MINLCLPASRWRRWVLAAATVAVLAGLALVLPGVGAVRSSASMASVTDPGTYRGPSAGLQGWSSSGRLITVGGSRRGYLLLRPSRPPPGRMPVVVVLHGRGMTPWSMVERTGMLQLRGALLVVPAGYGRSWNAGDCCGAARRARVDDVAFVSAVLAQVLSSLPAADPRQVYLVGYSNGGRLAYRLACQRPELFAGVAAVEAVPVYGCRSLAHGVPLVVVASTGDPLLRITPSAPPKRIDGDLQQSVTGAVRDWLALEGCTGSPRARSEGGLTTQLWTACRPGGRVEFDLYRGGGHAWPAPLPGTPGALEEIWSFVRA